MSKIQIQKVKDDLIFIEDLFRRLLKILPAFNTPNKKILPYGLKKHTRSISWLAEQVVTQQIKFQAKKLGIKEAEFDFPDTCLHDCKIETGNHCIFVNVKMHNMVGKEAPNDIAAAKRLLVDYKSDKNYGVIYACVGVRFAGRKVKFDTKYLHVFSPQFLPTPIKINKANKKIQARYDCQSRERSRDYFLKLVGKSYNIAMQKKK